MESVRAAREDRWGIVIVVWRGGWSEAGRELFNGVGVGVVGELTKTSCLSHRLRLSTLVVIYLGKIEVSALKKHAPPGISP